MKLLRLFAFHQILNGSFTNVLSKLIFEKNREILAFHRVLFQKFYVKYVKSSRFFKKTGFFSIVVFMLAEKRDDVLALLKSIWKHWRP